MRFLRAFGRGLQNGFVAIGALAFLGTVIAVAANYAVTVGTGTTFGSVVVGGVNYAQQLICDLTTPSQCAAVDSSGNLSVKSSTLSTAANQATEITDLGTIATNTGASIPAGTALIGGVETYDAGGSVKGTIKAASTASVAGDTSHVMQINPMQPQLSTPLNVQVTNSGDACLGQAKTNLAISFQQTGSLQLIALSGSTKIYVCSLSLIASVATVFSLTGGTGTNCGTPAAVIGTTSASNGLSLAANGGLTLGNGGGTVASTAAGSELCLVQSGAGNLVGNLTYVQQ